MKVESRFRLLVWVFPVYLKTSVSFHWPGFVFLSIIVCEYISKMITGQGCWKKMKGVLFFYLR